MAALLLGERRKRDRPLSETLRIVVVLLAAYNTPLRTPAQAGVGYGVRRARSGQNREEYTQSAELKAGADTLVATVRGGAICTVHALFSD